MTIPILAGVHRSTTKKYRDNRNPVCAQTHQQGEVRLAVRLVSEGFPIAFTFRVGFFTKDDYGDIGLAVEAVERDGGTLFQIREASDPDMNEIRRSLFGNWKPVRHALTI